jgi:glycerol-3-phosphate acyltransferase PlsY
MLGLSAWLGLAALATWLAVAATFRYSSLAALSAAIAAPFFAWWLLPDRSQALALVVIAMLVIWRHKSNIVKLLAGQEGRIGARKT